MRLTVLGGCGAWPGAGQACSGYLVEHDGHRVLTHLRPGADRQAAVEAAAENYDGEIDVAAGISVR